MKFLTIDASVLVRGANNKEAGHEECRRLISLVGTQGFMVALPTLALTEFAAGLARLGLPEAVILTAMDHLRRMPVSIFVSLDAALAEEAAEVAIERKLRGANAVYVATARRFGAMLVTVDERQRVGVPADVTALTPVELLGSVAED